MAELTAGEQLNHRCWIALPTMSQQRRKRRGISEMMSLQQIRAAVERDLASLLNAGNLETSEDLEQYPQLKHSVLNFGIPDLAATMSLARNRRLSNGLCIRQFVISSREYFPVHCVCMSLPIRTGWRVGP